MSNAIAAAVMCGMSAFIGYWIGWMQSELEQARRMHEEAKRKLEQQGGSGDE